MKAAFPGYSTSVQETESGEMVAISINQDTGKATVQNLGVSAPQGTANANANTPASYDEWSLAGGQEGTGMSYADYLTSGGENQTDETQNAIVEIQKYASELDKLMSNDDISWATAWNRMKQRYPGMSNEAIDEALGLEYRDKYNK